ncbi:MAG: hypothetical protein COU51_03235 [Parcubacteria group bacterium CG10_big_fil_rev_8_21_14_0_10_36_14]|nr:MAG: hypothetical protein COU51_03235 [Parcubacteria group bacterium CG10_big_fil_rev_8_21_14_0_10_36_14]
MFKIAVLGAGEQAQGVAYYLNHDPRVKEFVCYDNDDMRLYAIRKYLGSKGHIFLLDADDPDILLRVLQEGKYHGVFNALPYRLLPKTTQTIIMAGLPGVDLGQATGEQEYLRDAAEQIDVSYARGCGMAPGIISDVGFAGIKELDKCFSVRMYCGGILQNPRGKLGHASFFSVPGLYYEYAATPYYIFGGKKVKGEPLMPGNSQTFVLHNDKKIINTEAAVTAEAFEPDIELWEEVSDTVSYATLRHTEFSHFTKVRKALATKNEEEFIDWLWRNLIPKEGERDMMVWRVYVVGEKAGVKTTIIYESICMYNEQVCLSAMQQYTAFPATETLLQILSHPQSWPAGFPYHERHINMALLKTNLLRHGLVIKKTIIPDLS